MTAPYLLGVDIGTSGCKAVALGVDGVILAKAEQRYSMSVLRPGWAEQEPRQWWAALVQAVREMTARLPLDAVAVGVGVTGQMHSLVPLDAGAEVIRPSILWCDRRSEPQAREIGRALGTQSLLRITRNPSRAAFTASKILWLNDNEPDSFKRLRHILLPKDWIVFQLTGTMATELSDASGTGLFDVPNGCWSDELLSALGISVDLLPAVLPSTSVVGDLLPPVASALGLPPAIPVIAGAGDQAAGSFDTGAASTGVIACNLGTSVVLTESVSEPLLGALSHVVQDQWLYLTSAHSGTVALDWWSRIAGDGRAQDIVEQASKSEPGARGARFIPLLMGSRDQGTTATPPHARFTELREDHTRADLSRAVLEGVALEIRHIARDLPAQNGVKRSWRTFGGGVRSRFFVQVIADVLGSDLTVVPDASSARGAARLAAAGLGHHPSRWGSSEKVTFARPTHAYDQMYAGYVDAVGGGACPPATAPRG